MKSPTVLIKSTLVAMQTIALKRESDLPTRRLTDITPASRVNNNLFDVPTSPKLHELIERSRHH
jgi:hypothetical protein